MVRGNRGRKGKNRERTSLQTSNSGPNLTRVANTRVERKEEKKRKLSMEKGGVN